MHTDPTMNWSVLEVTVIDKTLENYTSESNG